MLDKDDDIARRLLERICDLEEAIDWFESVRLTSPDYGLFERIRHRVKSQQQSDREDTT